MDDLLSRLTSRLELILWLVAIGLAVAILLWLAPGVFNFVAVAETPLPTASRSPRPTQTLTRTPTALLPTRQAKASPPTPTPPPGAVVLDFRSDLARSGWLMSGQNAPRFGDRNLFAGTYRDQTFSSLLYFNLPELTPGSKILFAEVELTGLDGGRLSATGSWTLKLLPAAFLNDWATRANADFVNSKDETQVGSALTPDDLVEGQANRFQLSAEQRAQLENIADTTGRVAFRIDGPVGMESLFTWDGGDRDPAIGKPPVLRLVFVPGQYVFITHTPTPLNVITAAARVVEGTAFATRYGTPTPLPRKYATQLPNLVITPIPTPANAATETAQAEYATAVAMTTGTFTPTPRNLSVATLTPTPTFTPTPPWIAASQVTPYPTLTPPPPEVTIQEYLKTPIPSDVGLRGNILFWSDRSGRRELWFMNPQGAVLGRLADREYYQIAAAYELASPNRLSYVDVAKDLDDRWMIPLFDVKTGLRTPLIQEPKNTRGIGAYHPAWSPLGDKIVYVSEQSAYSEIYVYDLNTRRSTRLTYSQEDPKWGYPPYNKHPSWSPDGKQIIFFSERETYYPIHNRLWIMNADGSGLRCLTPDDYDNSDPIWVK